MESRTTGTGEVHTHLSNQPDKGRGDSGKFDLDGEPQGARDRMDQMAEGARDRMSEVGERAQERAGAAMDQARGTVDDLRGRAGEMASSARERASEMLNQAERTLDERTGALGKARDNPLAALGVAFAIGFMLAGSDDDSGRKSKGSTGKMRQQIKGALMGGISAAISQQLRTYIEEQGGIGGVIESLSGQGSGPSTTSPRHPAEMAGSPGGY